MQAQGTLIASCGASVPAELSAEDALSISWVAKVIDLERDGQALSPAVRVMWGELAESLREQATV